MKKVSTLFIALLSPLWLGGCDELAELFNDLENNLVETSCGGSLIAYDEENEYSVAAIAIKERYPHLNAAQQASSPRFTDAHPTVNPFDNHAELEGFGVTMIQIEDGIHLLPQPVEAASGELDEPSLLFFRKGDAGQQDDWEIIGYGYTFNYNPNSHPVMNASSTPMFDVHEAGYHHSPGDGGFTCAVTADLEQDARDRGLTVDAAACNDINEDDLQTKTFMVKHGRYWTIHFWFQPGTDRIVQTNLDPWCRQSTNAVAVTCNAFKEKGSCP